ncbi:hypothetical protein, partial [Streptomyces sp. URMC 123]|uniref:hypothetical protein n=1 Tax=Streptomyces sp. URMC 123 TaxID=3423403 RepID=UPI003F1968A5
MNAPERVTDGARRRARHELEPGKLLAGLALVALAVVYGLDAVGAWQVPTVLVLPLVLAGLVVAGALGALLSAARSAVRRSARRRGAPSPGTGSGPSSGSDPGFLSASGSGSIGEMMRNVRDGSA